MSRSISIGEAEWQVMEALWASHAATFADIRTSLKHCGWTQTTIHTMLSRLQGKGLVNIDQGSSPYVYKPAVSREECRIHETKTFLQKVYNGSLKLLISSFINDADLSDDDVNELLRTLEKRKGRKGKVSKDV